MSNATLSDSPAAPAASSDAFLPVPVQAREDGWTPRRQREFIEHLADSGCVRDAARRVGMTEQSAYRLRRRAGGGSFDLAWRAALEKGLERLAAIAVERAIAGRVKKVFYHGELIHEEVVHSDRLLMFLLQRGRLLLGRDKERTAACADWDGALEKLGEQPEGPYRVWQHEEDGVWLTNFPPPPGFRGWSEKRPGHPGYRRVLSPEEEEFNTARRRQEETGERLRDDWFGFSYAPPPPRRSNRAGRSDGRR